MWWFVSKRFNTMGSCDGSPVWRSASGSTNGVGWDSLTQPQFEIWIWWTSSETCFDMLAETYFDMLWSYAMAKLSAKSFNITMFTACAGSGSFLTFSPSKSALHRFTAEATETDRAQSRISCRWAAYVGVQLDFCAASTTTLRWKALCAKSVSETMDHQSQGRKP